MVMMFAPCGDRGRSRHLACLILLCCSFWFRPYVLSIQCYESVMGFAPGGDGGCPHQPVSGIMCTTVFVFLLLTSVWWWCNPWTDTNKTGADVVDRP